MNLAARLYVGFGSLAMLLCWVLALTGTTFSSNSAETVPTSVRENPSSFRSSYAGWTGFHPLPSGGGFSFGK